MKLKALLRGLELETRGSKEVEILSLTNDSRTAAPGSLFIAKKGTAKDGADFVGDAVRSGAVAIVSDALNPFVQATQVVSPDPASLEPKLASRFYGTPSKELFVVGITGTKGKTTTTYMVWHLLRELEGNAGLINTVETITPREQRPSTLTTHSAIQNHKLLREIVTDGARAVALEVSSHGLQQGRVGEVQFDMALFTNLYPDHLDYHKTVEEYAAAKRRLFTQLDTSSKRKRRAVFNADSEWSTFMREGCSSPSWTVGFSASADLSASDACFEPTGASFTATFQGRSARFRLPVFGRFNIANALMAMTVGLEKGANLSQMVPIFERFQPAPGRLEAVPNTRGFHVFVDFAHSGEPLANVLTALRELARSRLICVFGCGGDRDPGRRTTMARAADHLADIVVVTSDNPRTEDPAAIIRDILAGFRDPAKAKVVPERRAAIHEAIALAREGDIVLIAGKGHEKVQIFAHQTVPFDDVAVAAEALR